MASLAELTGNYQEALDKLTRRNRRGGDSLSRLRPTPEQAAAINRPPPPPEPESDAGFLSDTGNLSLAGLAQIAQGAGYLTGLEGIEDWGREAAQSRMQRLSPEMQESLAKEFISYDEDEGYGIGDAVTDPRAIYGALVQSLPATAAGMGLGGLAARGLAGLGSQLAARGVAGGSTLARPAVSGAAGFGAGEGAVSAGIAGSDAKDFVMNADAELLSQSPRFQEYVNQGMTVTEAREATADDVAGNAALGAGAVVSLLGAPMGAVLGRWIGGQAPETVMRGIGMGAAGEAAQEAAQSAGEDYFTGTAISEIDPSQAPTLASAANAAVGGALAGGVMGGGLGGLAARMQRSRKARDLLEAAGVDRVAETADREIVRTAVNAARNQEQAAQQEEQQRRADLGEPQIAVPDVAKWTPGQLARSQASLSRKGRELNPAQQTLLDAVQTEIAARQEIEDGVSEQVEQVEEVVPEEQAGVRVRGEQAPADQEVAETPDAEEIQGDAGQVQEGGLVGQGGEGEGGPDIQQPAPPEPTPGVSEEVADGEGISRTESAPGVPGGADTSDAVPLVEPPDATGATGGPVDTGPSDTSAVAGEEADRALNTNPRTTADDVTAAFDAMAAGARRAGRDRVLQQLRDGDDVVFRNPQAAATAEADSNYNTVRNDDGSVSVIGALDPDTGQWAGTPKVTPPGDSTAMLPQGDINAFNKAAKFFANIVRLEEGKRGNTTAGEAVKRFDSAIQSQPDAVKPAFDRLTDELRQTGVDPQQYGSYRTAMQAAAPDAAPVAKKPQVGGAFGGTGAKTPTDAADQAAPVLTERPDYPFGDVAETGDDRGESRFFNSRIRVAPSIRGEQPYEGTVRRVLNGGRLIEVQPDGMEGSFRVSGDRVEVLEVQDNLPTVETAASPQADRPAAPPPDAAAPTPLRQDEVRGADIAIPPPSSVSDLPLEVAGGSLASDAADQAAPQRPAGEADQGVVGQGSLPDQSPTGQRPDRGSETAQTEQGRLPESVAPEPPPSIADTSPQESPVAGESVAQGKRVRVVTPAQTEVEADFVLADANALITSNDSTGNINPDYPAALQPRDRQRATSQTQVNRIARGIRPELLGDTGTATGGAPIVGPDGVVESGNGRTLALRQAYREGGADGYKQWLRDNARQFGLTPEQVDAMDAPVLVRRRATEMSDAERAQFAREANQSDVQAMSPSEIARADAERIDANMLNGFAPSEDGNVLSASNRSFVQNFARALGETEAAGLRDADGNWTRQMSERITSAIFAKAYGSNELLTLQAEAADPDARSIVNALTTAAGEFARARAMDETLNNGALDITTPLVEAVRLVRSTPPGRLEERLGQSDMFSGETDADVAELARFIDTNKRSAKRMGEAFKAMGQYIRNELRSAERMVGEPATRGDVISAATGQNRGQRTLEESAPGRTAGGQQPQEQRTEAAPAAEGEDKRAQLPKLTKFAEWALGKSSVTTETVEYDGKRYIKTDRVWTGNMGGRAAGLREEIGKGNRVGLVNRERHQLVVEVDGKNTSDRGKVRVHETTWTPAEEGEEVAPKLSVADARKRIKWMSMGTEGGVTTHDARFTNDDGAFITVASVSRSGPKSQWRVDDTDADIDPDHSLAKVKRAAIDNVAIPLLIDQGYVAAEVAPDVRYSRANRDADYLAAVERGDMEAAQRMVLEAAEASGLPILEEAGVTAYRARRSAAPEKTVKAYKLFRAKKSRPGDVFALFVGAADPLPKGVWLDATEGPKAQDSKTGKAKVKSKLGNLAYRPGWHAGDIPLATHIGAKDEAGNVFARKDDEVWAEVEMAADVDYQPEADANGTRDDGRFVAGDADIKHMPDNGLYRYKTNPNMTGQWIISGSMKINRVLSESEVNAILKRADAATMPWATQRRGSKRWTETPLDLSRWGLDTNPAKNQKKLLDPVTYDDAGNVIPLSQRFDPAQDDIRYAQGRPARSTVPALREALGLTPAQERRIGLSIEQSPGEGVPADVAGMYRNGDIVLFADNLTADEVRPTLLHEVAHKATREAMATPAFQQILDTVDRLRGRQGVFAEAERRLRRSEPELTKGFDENPNGRETRMVNGREVPALLTYRERYLDEVLAYAAQTDKGRKSAPFKRLVALIRDYLRRMGLVRRYSENDLVQIAPIALRRLARGETMVQSYNGMAEPVYHRVFHGTPHLWQPEPGFPHGRPRLDKMGTGEGHQVYGFGVYLAEAEEVARSYQDELSERIVRFNGRTVDLDSDELSGDDAVLSAMFDYLESGDSVTEAHSNVIRDLQDSIEYHDENIARLSKLSEKEVGGHLDRAITENTKSN